MKKIFSFLTLLLACASLHAQSWVAPNEGTYNGETVVYATLTTNLNGVLPSQLCVGAFIDDECRASSSSETTPSGELYVIRVQGDQDLDNGKPITFKVCDTSTGNEYPLTCAQAVTFNNATYGYPSGGVQLSLTVATSYTLDFTEAEVGHEYDVTTFLTVEPQGAVIPENAEWSISLANDPNGDPSPYASLKGTTLQGVSPYMQGIILTLSNARQLTGGPGAPLATTTFNVVQHAITITLLQNALTVNKDSYDLSGIMGYGSLYTLDPDNSTDVVQWETNDPTILEWNDQGYFIPIKAGTALMRPYIIRNDMTKLVPADDKWITVTVVVPVTDIVIDNSKYGGQFKANIGDTHLYERLVNIMEISPLDATDKSFTITVDNPSVVSLTGATTLTATGVGSAFVTVTANGSDPQKPVSQQVQIDVVDPTTTVNIASNQLTIPLTDGNPQDITTEVQNNVTLSTAGGSLVSEVDGTVDLTGTSVTCSPAPGLDLGGITGTFTAQTEGTTTVTINLRWPDYDSWGVSTDVLQYNTAQFSFTIKVTNSLTLSHFNVAVANAVAGLPGTISFTPQPAGASYDLNNLMVDINNGLAGPWANALTSSLSSATDDLIVYEFTSTIPCQINVAVTINGVPVVLNDPSSPVGNAFSGFEIGWPFELSSGWQWRSNPCGFIPANQLATYYGNGDLIEIRTNNSLLYNDPAWGFYGTLASTPGILQGQCYKVNMKAARSTVLMGSSVTDEATQVAGTVNMTNSSYSVTLKPGWNWVGSPYLFNRELDNIFSGQVANLKDVVIIGKTGSAELNSTTGQWTGNLLTLNAGEGYIIKNPGNSNIELTFPSEQAWEPTNDGGGAGVKELNPLRSVWEYDHTRFMNNMTMVAELEGIDQPEQYSVGAFVGDECRGEGVIIDGKAFITVHCDAGEYVTFQLYNTCTGAYTLVDNGLKAQTRVGSLKAPFRMRANIADGISNVNGETGATETYDLSGRRTTSQQRGVALRRMIDGTVRKVVVK